MVTYKKANPETKQLYRNAPCRASTMQNLIVIRAYETVKGYYYRSVQNKYNIAPASLRLLEARGLVQRERTNDTVGWKLTPLGLEWTWQGIEGVMFPNQYRPTYFTLPQID